MNEVNDKGYKHGYWEKYCPDGNLWYKGVYINGLKDGYWGKYFSNGNPWYKGHYINGKEDGYWEWYNIDSKLVLKAFHL